MIEIVVLSLLIIFITAYYTLGKNPTRPTILYVFGFFACSVVAYLYKEEWGLHTMSPSTVFLLIGGAFVFYIVEYRDYKCHFFHPKHINVKSDPLCPISAKRLMIFLCFQLLTLALIAHFVKSYASTQDLSAAILEVNDDKKFNGNSIIVPFYVRIPSNFCLAALAYWCALFPYYMFKSKKYFLQKILLGLNLVAGVALTMLGGGRTNILYAILSVMSVAYMCMQFKCHWRGGLISRKFTIIVVTIMVLFITSFMYLGEVVGRRETQNPAELIMTMYCGAEIKNLDDYIQKPYRQGNETGRFAQYTMCAMYDAIDPYFGKKPGNGADISFNSYDGYPLGNVYTCYYDYTIDFGIWGALLVAGVMSFITSLFYRKTITSNFFKTGKVNLWMAYYTSKIPGVCILSFFSNKLFADFVIIGTIKTIIFWMLLSAFLYYNIPVKSSQRFSYNKFLSKKRGTSATDVL